MKPPSPQSFDGDICAAFELAVAQHEPIFLPISIFADERGWSMMNLFRGALGPRGQVNYSMMYPGVIKAWHSHKRQSDFWLSVMGHVKVGVHREDDGQSWMAVIGEQNPGIMIIPPTLWHGAATVGHLPAGLLYYVTEGYNLNQPDELRRPFDSIAGFSWDMGHG